MISMQMLFDPDARVWIDFPAISEHRHNFNYSLNFADGHSVMWRHMDRRTKAVHHNGTEQAGNRDLERLADAAATRRDLRE